MIHLVWGDRTQGWGGITKAGEGITEAETAPAAAPRCRGAGCKGTEMQKENRCHVQVKQQTPFVPGSVGCQVNLGPRL